MKEIEGKVAEIIDLYTIVINRGRKHGVEEDMRFVIYEPGDIIEDPDTSKPLGNFEHIKAKVKVTYAREKFSTAETYITYTVPTVPYTPILTREYQKRQELPLDRTMREQLLKHLMSPVKVGDLVRQILD
ncbi:MAG: hypothetical protein KAT49_00330 [Methanomicrobia archaeon]|nr:hypothetical protein [Methanomicrobia archaeon]